MIKWSDDYLIGIEEIDNQHKRLFEITDEAFNLLKDDLRVDKYDEIVSILEELKSYTLYHFKSEEEYMLRVGYKRYFSQKVDHDDFIEKINNIDLNKVDEDQNAYLMSIVEFAVQWISDHIIQKDMLIAKP